MSENPLDKIDEADLNEWLDEWPETSGKEAADSAEVPNHPNDGDGPIHSTPEAGPAFESIFFSEPLQPDSVEETARKSGLAFSIGIVLFTSIAFMLFIGWGADLVLGTSPWGIVCGIVLGSVIGFVQIFRITSQIFDSDKPKSKIRPLLSDDDDDQ